MSTTTALVVATTFLWLGMVLAISFLEAPLKFRAEGLTVQVGLNIGRLVFGALNIVEAVLALVLAIAFLIDAPPRAGMAALAVATVVLVVQLVLIRPLLARRTNAVLADSEIGIDTPRSHVHLWYVGAELVKVIALILGGILLLAD
ncbi:MAG: hypothetical protein L0H31_05435 [Nocardioidaceae bacterium]|nr:hypothetical protein [Nocardioidaceae bacterium]